MIIYYIITIQIIQFTFNLINFILVSTIIKMNSLEIYEIKEINNIITNYQTQFEKIDKLEIELYFGNTEIQFSMGMNKYKLVIQDFKFILYLNDEKIANKEHFINMFKSLDDEWKQSIYLYISTRIYERYNRLPFDSPYYFDCIEGILYDIFDDNMENMTVLVERHLTSAYDIEEQHIYVKHNRNFYWEIMNYLEDCEPMIREDYLQIYKFFKSI